jgi:site-specific recombinase XerC
VQKDSFIAGSIQTNVWLLNDYFATLSTRSQHTRDAYQRDISQFTNYLARGLASEPKKY